MTTTNEEFKIDQLIGFLDNTNHSVHPTPHPPYSAGRRGGGRGLTSYSILKKVGAWQDLNF